MRCIYYDTISGSYFSCSALILSTPTAISGYYIRAIFQLLCFNFVNPDCNLTCYYIRVIFQTQLRILRLGETLTILIKKRVIGHVAAYLGDVVIVAASRLELEVVVLISFDMTFDFFSRRCCFELMLLL